MLLENEERSKCIGHPLHIFLITLILIEWIGW